MKVIIGELDREKLAQAEEALKEYPGASRKAIHDALRRTKTYMNKRSKQLIPKEYDITAQKLQKEGTVRQRINYTPNDGIEAATMFNGQLIALIKFSPNPDEDVRQSYHVWITKGGKRILVRPGVPVKAHLALSRSKKQIPNAFVAKMKNGHVGVFERTGEWTKKGNEAIRELTGNSIAHMVGHGEIADQILSDAQKVFHARLDSNVQRIREGKWKI